MATKIMKITKRFVVLVFFVSFVPEREAVALSQARLPDRNK